MIVIKKKELPWLFITPWLIIRDLRVVTIEVRESRKSNQLR